MHYFDAYVEPGDEWIEEETIRYESDYLLDPEEDDEFVSVEVTVTESEQVWVTTDKGLSLEIDEAKELLDIDVPTWKIIEGDDKKNYYKTMKWGKIRQSVLERDKHKCQNCSSPVQLQVHHLTYKRFGNEAMGDLATLCKSCHELAHKGRLHRFAVRH